MNPYRAPTPHGRFFVYNDTDAFDLDEIVRMHFYRESAYKPEFPWGIYTRSTGEVRVSKGLGSALLTAWKSYRGIS